MDNRRLIGVEKCCIGLTVWPKTGLNNKCFMTVDQGCVDRPAENCSYRQKYIRLYSSVDPLTVKLSELDCLLQSLQLYYAVGVVLYQLLAAFWSVVIEDFRLFRYVSLRPRIFVDDRHYADICLKTYFTIDIVHWRTLT